MRPWLRGDLDGVDPRADLGRLRDAVLAAAHAGEDLSRLYEALAALDPVACAELAAGPRAVAHPAAVRGALSAVGPLEGVLAPSGLYFRLADLAPEAAASVMEVAARRHPGADWVIRLARRCEPAPGATLLRLHRDTERYLPACRACARGGGVEALRTEAVETGSPLPAAALYREGSREEALDVAAATLEAHPGAPLLPYLAAVHGPDVGSLGEALLERLTSQEARDWLGRQVDALEAPPR